MLAKLSPLSLVVVAFSAGIGEEVFFRGFCQPFVAEVITSSLISTQIVLFQIAITFHDLTMTREYLLQRLLGAGWDLQVAQAAGLTATSIFFGASAIAMSCCCATMTLKSYRTLIIARI